MIELLLELLLELFGDFLLEFALAARFDLALRGIARVFETFRFKSAVLATISYLLFGVSAGCLSLAIFPHRLVHASRLHGISLLLSPLATGVAMSLLGSALSRYGEKPTRIESFRYGFALAFGIAIIRALFAS
jgi:hypothetical protein